jgi:hypothetical protein
MMMTINQMFKFYTIFFGVKIGIKANGTAVVVGFVTGAATGLSFVPIGL